MGDKIKVQSEIEFHKWFLENHKKIGYEKIIRKDIGKFPDFIMLKNGKKVSVELETELSNFIQHNHNIKNVDEIVCIKNNLSNNLLDVPIIEIKELEYKNRLERVSATINEKLSKKLDSFLKKNSRFRNKSHVIEEAIEEFIEQNKGRKKK